MTAVTAFPILPPSTGWAVDGDQALAACEFPALLRQQVVPETEVLKQSWMFSSGPPQLSSKAQALSPTPRTVTS